MEEALVDMAVDLLVAPMSVWWEQMVRLDVSCHVGSSATARTRTCRVRIGDAERRGSRHNGLQAVGPCSHGGRQNRADASHRPPSRAPQGRHQRARQPRSVKDSKTLSILHLARTSAGRVQRGQWVRWLWGAGVHLQAQQLPRVRALLALRGARFQRHLR